MYVLSKRDSRTSLTGNTMLTDKSYVLPMHLLLSHLFQYLSERKKIEKLQLGVAHLCHLKYFKKGKHKVKFIIKKKHFYWSNIETKTKILDFLQFYFIYLSGFYFAITVVNCKLMQMKTFL